MKRGRLNALLFVLTFLFATVIQGPLYAVAILSILVAHETGHFLMCRRHGVAATLPLFIPMPNLFGTMGAVIAIKSPIPDRKALFDIGIAGPLAGMAIAVPAAVIGLHLSQFAPKPVDGTALSLGAPLLFQALVQIVKGTPGEGMEIFLHPIAFAAWAAFFVTAINLLPAGQLDGGHIAYAALGPRDARRAYWLTLATLAYLGARYQWMWFTVLALAALFLRRHPPTLNDTTPLDPRRSRLSLLALALLITCFTPVPFVIP